ncbi:uncharacterized protein BJ171DRAFT_491372 [Polychytrium aggregatum]|uniref:uncharacterized protein n=1 Tax=Polychytrium aggregatum TaxID=110093 RepID=UPI0022FEEE72|nr:uncharacterized protein BJ171DRAFT_491372 [Polychytrium aggregatum]KAI9207753.1 hypothetical protein BJ171DRAFT_491372 [Polychytrium aggregatum]
MSSSHPLVATGASSSSDYPIPYAWDLAKRQPTPLPTFISKFTIELDEEPTFNGDEDSCAGTDLCGSITLDAFESLPLAKRLIVVLQGVHRLAADGESFTAKGSSHSLGALTEVSEFSDSYLDSREVWTGTGLPRGPNSFRFFFKLPGHLPATIPGLTEYLVRAQLIADRDYEVIRPVTVHRVGLGSPDGVYIDAPPAWDDDDYIRPPPSDWRPHTPNPPPPPYA